ncbi:MAG TPA: nucleotide sugar dehydrogenase [Conexibacter sp.]|jgi:nucleotide sugar dehydrogenase
MPEARVLTVDDAQSVAAALRQPAPATIAVVGLGYVGLPTALALHAAGAPVIGIDVSEQRLRAIRAADVDLPISDIERLDTALGDDGSMRLSSIPAAVAAADAVIICVPTPVDEARRPDPRALNAACANAVAHARAGQTLVLTSTISVGSTRELLVEPLERRGLRVGEDVFVAFAPERILPGDPTVAQSTVPRVVGGATPRCAEITQELLAPTAGRLHVVSSLEAAEFTKLYENTFRAVNLAFANEMATVSGHLGLDPVEIIDAAATKPYGFLAHYPGPGVGGHCIPVDPYYLLEPLREAGVRAAIAEEAMEQIEARPSVVARRALDLLRQLSVEWDEATALVVGMAYKPGVADARESPGLAIADELARAGVDVAFHDPRVKQVRMSDGSMLRSVPRPSSAAFDIVVVTALHGGAEREWLAQCDHVLDATYRAPLGRHRHVV